MAKAEQFAADFRGAFGPGTALTKTFAREAAFLLARAGKLDDDSIGFTVNTVTPGYISTEMVAAVPEKVLDRSRTESPCADSAGRRRLPGSCTSRPRRRRRASPGRSGASTAEWTCSGTDSSAC